MVTLASRVTHPLSFLTFLFSLGSVQCEEPTCNGLPSWGVYAANLPVQHCSSAGKHGAVQHANRCQDAVRLPVGKFLLQVTADCAVGFILTTAGVKRRILVFFSIVSFQSHSG